MNKLPTTNYPLPTSTGFTLIELLLYIPLAASIILSVSILLSYGMQSRTKGETMAEIDQQGTQVMQVITQTLRNAQTITSPTSGNTANGTTVDVVTGSLDPTVFDVSGGILRITEGAGSPVSLTNSRVTASNVSFANVSRPGTFGALRISFTLTRTSGSGRNEYDYSQVFTTTATLRQ